MSGRRSSFVPGTWPDPETGSPGTFVRRDRRSGEPEHDSYYRSGSPPRRPSPRTIARRAREVLEEMRP